MMMRGWIGYVAAFVAGVGVLYGVMVAGVPVPLVAMAPSSSYEQTAVQVSPAPSTLVRLRTRLEQGWEVDSTSEQRDAGDLYTTYILRRRTG